MRANVFMALMAAERKIDRREGLTLTEEEVAAVRKHGLFPKKLCACGCGKELEPRVDGERHRIGGKEVNSDCYFDSFGKELEEFPILPPWLRRRATGV